MLCYEVAKEVQAVHQIPIVVGITKCDHYSVRADDSMLQAKDVYDSPVFYKYAEQLQKNLSNRITTKSMFPVINYLEDFGSNRDLYLEMNILKLFENVLKQA